MLLFGHCKQVARCKGALFTGVRGIGILRTSPLRSSRKFAEPPSSTYEHPSVRFASPEYYQDFFIILFNGRCFRANLTRGAIRLVPCLRKYAREQAGGANDVLPSKEVSVRRLTVLVTAIGVALLLASGVALAATFDGTDGNDTFVGTDGPDDIRGRAGNDTLSGAGGIDRVRGDGGNDTLSGGPGGTVDQRERVEGDGGNDTTSGDGGADEVRGGLGDDDMLGGGGADFIRADDAGIDEVIAGIGADVIEAHDDAGVDTIDCGDGVDTVDFDAGVDVVAANCENQDPH